MIEADLDPPIPKPIEVCGHPCRSFDRISFEAVTCESIFSGKRYVLKLQNTSANQLRVLDLTILSCMDLKVMEKIILDRVLEPASGSLHSFIRYELTSLVPSRTLSISHLHPSLLFSFGINSSCGVLLPTTEFHVLWRYAQVQSR